ncbi:hypothetical protein [Streptomyces cyslabdanicus]
MGGQAGVAACRRCPAVATRHHTDGELSTLVADPATSVGDIDAHFARSS